MAQLGLIDDSCFSTRLERHNSAINLSSVNTGIADFSMNSLREVNGEASRGRMMTLPLGVAQTSSIKVDFRSVFRKSLDPAFLAAIPPNVATKGSADRLFRPDHYSSCTSSELCLLPQVGAFPWFEFELQRAGLVAQLLRCEGIRYMLGRGMAMKL